MLRISSKNNLCLGQIDDYWEPSKKSLWGVRASTLRAPRGSPKGVPFGLAPKDSKMLDRLLGAPPSEVGEMSRYVTVWLSRSSCKGFFSLRRQVAGLFFQVGTQQFHVTASGVSSSQANLGLIPDTACV